MAKVGVGGPFSVMLSIMYIMRRIRLFPSSSDPSPMPWKAEPMPGMLPASLLRGPRRLLLRAGADIKFKGALGHTTLYYAKRNGASKIWDLLNESALASPRWYQRRRT